MKKIALPALGITIAGILMIPLSCALTPAPSPSSTAVYSQYQLEYRLIAAYPDIFW